jgi:hypothetical protein
MDFIGADTVNLRAGTANYPMSFSFAPASATDAGDGSIPFGTTITGVSVTVVAFGGADVTTATVGQAMVDGTGLVVNTAFNFPPLAKKGQCKVLLALTLSTGSVVVKRWDGLKVE